MKITIRGKNIEVTDALKSYAEKKIKKLDKYFEKETEAQVCLSVTRGNNIIEVTILLNGIILRGEEATNDMYASIDQVVEKLERQIKKYKTKLTRNLRQKAPKFLKTDVDEQEEHEELEIVKVKRFAIKPMTVDEAVLQMNLLGHNFFVFYNAETGDVNVLYQRKDGNYGLIEPDLS